MENELPKLRIDSTGKGFYQADDANDEDAVCEYSKAIAIISQLRDEIALLKKGCPFEEENKTLRDKNERQSTIIGECEASINALTIKNERLAALDWTPISEENPVKPNDMLLFQRGDFYNVQVVRSNEIPFTSRHPFKTSDWLQMGATHRRPINPPRDPSQEGSDAHGKDK